MADIPSKPNLTSEEAALFDRDLPEVVEWESFYAEGKRTPLFLRNVPDEHLVGFVEQGRLESGSAIDLGCGIGRNAIYLAKAGFRVDAIDLSRTAITRGRQSAGEGRVRVNFIVGSVFDIPLRENHYDVAYDSGLFHHLPPHRRQTYLDLVRRALKPDGCFGMTCFDATGGQPVEDREIYERGKMPPGIGYSEDRLRGILRRFFEIVELRPMKVCPEDAEVLGMPGLWTVLMKPNRSASL
ncbi:MAG: class I SAM-dependent methyltransferase [Gemmatimonadetes bacterium]|nr:class I SAM-dependent methyltransferase [Gemmatimonadota bacterium]MDE3260042.1 class I SAM-dependent methyltransferase [Gemmatimonadota bacterium]